MKKKKLDKYSKHELLDRSYLAMTIFDTHVAQHFALPKKYHKKADKVIKLMHEFYQDMDGLVIEGSKKK